ncbi:M48 family metallopeptidase [Parvularcula marina]|uniref:M48 family peptidase n=1 Tax=Parvularcula marina TaxID=2292771 RepID=A0A371REM3_9PROT|nr:M48 family metallopeptidase [Parvularcula marina]RFB03892.1 M48 family peptidase [Parvularcula marina]
MTTIIPSLRKHLKSLAKPALGLGALAAVLAGCTYNEELGRSQLLLGDPSSMVSQANQAWAQIKQQERISTDPRYTSRLDRVSVRLIRAMGDDPARWEYRVFDSDDLNAFALPGNKIGVYTGIMDLMENDAQLAAVVGHEIQHVRYNHSQERYAQQTLGQIGAVGVGVAVGSQCETDACRQRALQGATLGALGFFLLPNSREHELEADIGGLRLMVQAGYNPCEAIDFWRNMERASANSSRPPEFLSTHPAPGNRIAQLRAEASRLGYQCS